MKKHTSTNRKTIALFWEHVMRYKHYSLPLLFFVPVAVVLMSFILPYIMSQVLQRISSGHYQSHNLWGSFGKYIIAYAIGTFMSGVVAWRINIWLIWNLELNVTRDIAERVFTHLMRMSPNFHTNRFAGSLVSQANKLTGAYVRFTDATIFNLYTLAVALLATIVILAPRAPLYVLMLLVFSAIYIVGTMHFAKPVRDANAEEATAQSEQTGNLADAITNVMAIKSFSSLAFEEERYAQSVGKSRRKGLMSMRKTMIRETYSSMVTSSIGISALVIAIIGAGRFNANIATLFLIVSYTGNIGERLWEFQNVLRQYNRSLGDASDMVEMLQIESEIKDAPKPEKVRIIRGDIRFTNLTFTHAESDQALFKNLDLHVKAGEKVGLIGRSGSGKTTLTKLLLRFSEADSGSITIDGQDIRAITQDDLRNHIAYVPQEPLLFHRTLAENIAYGRQGAGQQEIEATAKLANAHDFIIGLPKAYDTLVGERGVKLSGGQRQRIAIARAMIKNAPILVLDEATSALDSESEGLIQDALWKLMERRTAIVIAHRLSTIQRMDRIVVLDEGEIVEQGSHKELLALNGTYAKLWSHQSGGFIED